jgi:putative transposase
MKSPQITISNLQRAILEKITRQTTSSVREVDRAKLILAINEGHSNTYLHHELGIAWNKVKHWRYRWLSYEPKFTEIESDKATKHLEYDLEKKIREYLADAPRPGTPSKFTAAEYCQILGVALEDPELSGRPISEWSLNELKDEVEKRAIVSSISRSQLGNFLKSERLKATQSGGLDEPKM